MQQQGDGLWILKTAQHLGKGLKLVTADQLVQEASSRCAFLKLVTASQLEQEAGSRCAFLLGCSLEGLKLVTASQLEQEAS